MIRSPEREQRMKAFAGGENNFRQYEQRGRQNREFTSVSVFVLFALFQTQSRARGRQTAKGKRGGAEEARQGDKLTINARHVMPCS